MAPAHRLDTPWLDAVERLKEDDAELGRTYQLPPFVSLDLINAWSAKGAAGAFHLVALEMARIGQDDRLTPERRAAVHAAFKELAKRLGNSAMFQRASAQD